MVKTILIIKNIVHEGPGILANLLDQRGINSLEVDLTSATSLPDPSNYSAVVVLGGPQSVNDGTPSMRKQLQFIDKALKQQVPYLGICLGMQALAKAAGGHVVTCPHKEIGFRDQSGLPYTIHLTQEGIADPLFKGLGKHFQVFQLHGETVQLPASGMLLLGSGEHCKHQAIRYGKIAYGIQCHFELTRDMLEEWVKIDPDLQSAGKHQMMQCFDAISDEYTTTGTTILSNFLSIAKLA